MSGAQRLASELNRLASNDLDWVGGADREAVNRLLDDYFLSEEEAGMQPLPGCKQIIITMNNLTSLL
jgi:hypothetical protein